MPKEPKFLVKKPDFDPKEPKFLVKKPINVPKESIFVPKESIFVPKESIFVPKESIFVPKDEIRCEKCEKLFSSAKTLRNHHSKGLCRGVPSLQCKDCGLWFNNRKAVYNHVARGKCGGAQGVTNNVTNHNTVNNVDQSVTHNTVNNVYVSFGSEDLAPITSEKFMNFLLQFHGPERLIPATKALYFHPNYPVNHGTLKPKSTKNKTLSVRRSDGSYYTGHLESVFNRFVQKVLPIVLPDQRSRVMVEAEISANKNTKYMLSKELLTLINESPVIPEEELERTFHATLPGPPPEAFRWPSELFWERVEGGFNPIKHVMYAEYPVSATELFGVAALYRELVGQSRLPPGVAMDTIDNGIDDRWTVVRAWVGGKWARVRREPDDVAFTTELGHFFACMAADMCEVMYSYGMDHSVIRNNCPQKLDALQRMQEDLVAGRRHAEAKNALYVGCFDV